MVKTCLCQELGTGAFALLATIVHTEDAAHYRRPVTWYNSQLMAVLGMSKDQLVRVRQKCVDEGWLHYVAGTKSRAGRYWVKIPQEAQGLDDQPTDEGEDGIPSENQTANPTESGRNPGQNPDGKPAPFNPVPDPSPNPKETRAQPADDQVEALYEAYPRHVAKARAFKAIRAALRKVGFEDLLSAVREYAAAVSRDDARFIPHPATWFNAERWTDDRSEWRTRSNGTNNGVANAARVRINNHQGSDSDVIEVH